MKSPLRFCSVVSMLLISLALSTHAGGLPFLHPLFADDAVLQRDVKLPVWGWTEPGATVTVSMGKTTAKTVAGADGRWQAELPPTPAGGPHELTVSGPVSATAKNILFGDVWLCAGQSNMDMGVGAATRGREETAAANFPKIRLLTTPSALSARPLLTAALRWAECRPDTIGKAGNNGGSFSAAAYFFGRDLHRELDVPIGLVVSAWGGTRIEPWSSARALSTVERLKSELEQIAQDDRGMSEAEWLSKFDPGSVADVWAARDYIDSKWGNMGLPGRWETGALPDFDGVVWFRREVTLPAEWAGKEAFLDLGAIDDADTAWFNGQRVGSSEVWDEKRHYRIPADLVKAGKNIIAVRVVDHSEGGGFFGKPENMRLTQEAGQAIPLAGPWRYSVGVQLSDKVKLPNKAGQDGNPNRPTALYNGMIAPLEPFAIKGFYWYQGEANVDNAWEYPALMGNMLADLRKQFHSLNLPAIIVQLPNFQQVQQQPVEEGNWPDMREAQLEILRRIPHTALVTTIDIGEAADIHPGNKQDVGHRAALAALGTVYKKDLVYSGPIYRKVTAKDGKLSLEFDHADKGLTATGGGPLKGFAIAGADGRFVNAEATIDGAKVVVWSAAVPTPTAVRYNWAPNPTGNFANTAGLPASPFRANLP